MSIKGGCQVNVCYALCVKERVTVGCDVSNLANRSHLPAQVVVCVLHCCRVARPGGRSQQGRKAARHTTWHAPTHC